MVVSGLVKEKPAWKEDRKKTQKGPAERGHSQGESLAPWTAKARGSWKAGSRKSAPDVSYSATHCNSSNYEKLLRRSWV